MALDVQKYYTEEHDYVEAGGSMSELTVTITLCEYRELIRNAAMQTAEIARLNDENRNYKELLDMMMLREERDEDRAIEGRERVTLYADDVPHITEEREAEENA